MKKQTKINSFYKKISNKMHQINNMKQSEVDSEKEFVLRLYSERSEVILCSLRVLGRGELKNTT